MKFRSPSKSTDQDNTLCSKIESIVKTTTPQLDIWTDCALGNSDANKAYNLSFSLTFKGNLVTEALEHALNAVVQRHESLRSSFSSDGIHMNIHKERTVNLQTKDLSEFKNTEKERLQEITVEEEANAAFDLNKGSLFRAKLIKINDLEHTLLLTYHHIIGDGLSIKIIFEELRILYSAFVNNETPELKTPESFIKYAKQFNASQESEKFKQTENYWVDIYKNTIPVVNLPIDYPRPPLRTYQSNRLDFPFKEPLIKALKELSKKTNCSLTTVLLAAYEVFLCKTTGQKDLVTGVPVSGNTQYNMPHLVGDCANLIPLRTVIKKDISFLEYITQRTPQLHKAYTNHEISFGQLLQKLSVTRDPSRIPLIPVTFTTGYYDELTNNNNSFSGLCHEFTINPKKYASFEIHLHACLSEKNSTFQWSYNSTLFKEETIHEMMISFEETITKLTSNYNNPLSEAIESDHLKSYTVLNDTEKTYPNISLSEVLNKQSKASPNNIALEYKNTKITYRDLHVKVNQFAHYLSEQGVVSGDYIAVSFPRSPELVYAILAIIQCGAAYLPLDHEYPSKRVEYMMEDSGAKYLLTSKELSLRLPKCSNTILIDHAMESLDKYPTTKLEKDVNPENVLYLLYTSGSTGKPKGAKITHKNVVNLLYSLENEPGIQTKDRVPFISTISFDIASFELFFPLFKGAVLVLPDHETSSDGRLFYDMLEKEKISLIVATPTTYQMLLDSGWTKKLPIKIWCCGEPLPAKLAKELIDRSDELWTLYGPTEVTIFSSCKHIKNEETIISVGPPIANLQYYIVDEDLNLLPPNAIGEIAIGGDGVGKGYLGKPELTVAKYIPNIFSDKKNAIMYLSGDIGKLLPSNEVMCLGRIDHQVKVRGHRIEIGEIEHALLSIKGIKSAIVLAKTDILIAFIIVDYKIKSELEEIRLWRNNLASQLPGFMVPHVFHVLDEMPRTLNDKIDRTALLKYESNSESEKTHTAPRNNEEKLVAEIWKESLKKESIDIFSNFFEMGGHSIMAVNVMVKLEKRTGIRIPLSALFQHATIEKFAKLLNTENHIESDYLVPLKPVGSKTPLFIVHGSGLNILNFAHIINHFDEEQPVYGFQGVGPNGYDNWFDSIEAMAAKYIESIIKINPNGPYAIGGFSFGGIVAFEIAKQLKEQGKTVSTIALLDSYVDSSYYYPSLSQKKRARYFDRTHRRVDYFIQMLTSFKSLKTRLDSKKVYLQKKYFGLKEDMTPEETIALEHFIEADGMVSKIVDKYQLIPQDVEVDLFRAENDESYKLDPDHLGWKKAAIKGVNIHNISGDHLSIVEPPNDKILARKIQEILDQRNQPETYIYKKTASN